MKKLVCIILVALFCTPVFGCQTAEKTPAATKETFDVDLTTLSSTMVYSEVYNMCTYPEQYLGKSVKMKGTFTYGTGKDRYYFACLIADATACCSQGIEFVLKDDLIFPDEYPKVGDQIWVSGVFDTYYEGSNRYCQLINATMRF